jgi:ubiquinone/menaquinone biosynthesis C-methylase UbiE
MNPDKTSDIQNFWTRSPETYSEGLHGGNLYDGKRVEFGTREFFENVDRRFITPRTHMHTDRPFGAVFPFDRYASSRILEIGCGMGTMAMQWAKTGCSYTAVDLSPMSIEMTSRRFELFGYSGAFLLGDARRLPFGDGSFDFGYSWGVLHHSPDLPQSLRELMRVIRKGGEFAVMLYNRNSLLYRYFIRFRQGFLNMESKFLNPLELASRYTDDFAKEGNPHTWPVTEQEIRDILSPYADPMKFWIHGSDVSTHLAHIVPVLGSRLPAWAVKPWARRYGWSLCFSGVRR